MIPNLHSVLVSGSDRRILIPSTPLVSVTSAAPRGINASLFPRPKPKETALDIFLPEERRVRSDSKPVNIFAWARRGKGKSLTIACLLSILRKGFKARKSTRRILSNFWLQFADYTSPYLLEELTENPFMAINAEIGLDEITGSVPGRRAMSRRNIDTARLIEQIRKLDCEFLFSTQFPTEVDKSLLRQVDLFILTEANIHPHARVNPALARKAYIDLFIFDYWGQFTGRFVPPQWPPPPYLADKTMRIFNICNVWNQYKTDEYIPTQWGSDEYLDNVVARQYDLVSGTEDEKVDDAEAGSLPQKPMLATDPSTLEGFIENEDRAGNGRINLTDGVVRSAGEKDDSITSRDRLEVYLGQHGYEMFGVSKQRFARKKK